MMSARTFLARKVLALSKELPRRKVKNTDILGFKMAKSIIFSAIQIIKQEIIIYFY